MNILTLFLLLLSSNLFSQNLIKSDSVGLDNEQTLSYKEIVYTKHILTYLYSDSVFTLKNKRILFSGSNFGSTIFTKSDFYKGKCIPWTEKGDQPHVQIIILSEGEIELIGYDIILIAWSKIPPTRKARKQFIANAKKNSIGISTKH